MTRLVLLHLLARYGHARSLAINVRGDREAWNLRYTGITPGPEAIQ